jgi:hypothetical protein
MKTNHLSLLLLIALGVTASATLGCREKTISTTVTLPAAQLVAVSAPSSPAPAPSDQSTPAAAPVARWADIKDLTYDQRIPFFNGFRRLESMVDAQITALVAKRAAMTSTANTKDWDFAMKEMVDARAYLKSTGDVLGNATPETWNQEKDRVGQAWTRTQDAFAKVNSSTTS